MAPDTPKDPASEKKKNRLAALERKHTTPPATSRQPPAASPFRPLASHTPKADPSDKNYSKLCPSVFNGIIAAQLLLCKERDANLAVDEVLRNLLGSNVKTANDIGSTINSRVQDRILLLDNPATQGGAIDRAKERAHSSHSRRSLKHLSLRQHRRLGSFNLPAEFQKYELYLPMHEMWKEYAKSLVEDCSAATIQSRLLTADLHGAILSVVESKSTSYIGTQGIMVRETENTFGIVTSKDKLRVVPKAGTVFMLQWESWRVTLFGNNLFLRSLHPPKRRQVKPTIEL